MSVPPDIAASPPTLRQHRSFVLYWCARSVTNAAYWMQAVAVGWQIYDLTGSALDLGLVGLVQFIPFVLLAVVVGPTIDRYDRRAIARACQAVSPAGCSYVPPMRLASVSAADAPAKSFAVSPPSLWVV